MIKHTKKPDCCCKRCLLVDAGGVKARSKKYADTRTTKFVPVATGWPGKERVWIPEPVAPGLADGLAEGLPFNTSAQLPPDTSQPLWQRKMSNRARSKFITNTIAVPLSSICSPLENSYKTTLRCSGNLTEAEGSLSGLYCGQRWCVVCSRIRTARMVAGYLPQLEAMSDKWFVTTTVPNVRGDALADRISEMLRVATLINRNLKEKKKLKYSSLRKLECTYNAVRRDYHPHFHFIFDSEEAARAYHAQWLERFPECSPKAQDVRPADTKAVKELFKYFTKIAASKRYSKITGKVVDYSVHIGPLDVMFQAMKGRRVFQPCGIVKAVSEEIEPSFSLPTERDLTACYSWMGTDWIDRSTGRVLTGWEPSSAVKELASHIVMPARRQVEEIDLETGEITTRDALHHGELANASPDADLNHFYGPLPPRDYREPVYCATRFSGAKSRRFYPRTLPAHYIQADIFNLSLSSFICKHSTQLQPVRFKFCEAALRQQRVKKSAGFVKFCN